MLAASSCSSQQHTIFDGVTYTDAHVTLIGMLFIAVALAMGAAIAIAGGVIAPARALADCWPSLPPSPAMWWSRLPDGM